MSEYQHSFVQRVEHQELIRRAQQERLANEVVRLRRERRRSGPPGPVVTLAPMRAADLTELARWLHSERALVAWAGRTFRWPLTDDQLEVWLQRTPERPGVTWTAWSDGRRVGTASLELHHQGRVAELGRVLVFGRRQAGTIAGALVRRVVSTAFEAPGTEVLRLCVDARDEERRAVYEQVGFRPFLVQATAVAVGPPTWNEVVEMALERPERAAA